ncbi:MAG: thiamine phosphate synthase [Thermodesulfobacteriota bacterium]
MTPLYLITDGRTDGGSGLLEVLEKALAGGVRLVQLREKGLGGRALLELARQVRALTTGFGAKLLVNDRADVAALARADGVHLTARSFTPEEARKVLGPEAVVGVSTHSADQALWAERGGADFITFGPVYPTPSKARYGEPLGLEKLQEVCSAMTIPVYAIGGIKAANAGDVLAAGASGVAVISAVMAAQDPAASAREILSKLGPAGTTST